MELRDPGCKRCQQSSAGDCGDHGARRYTMETLAPPAPKRRATGPEEDEVPPLPIAEPTMLLFHFICSMNGDHVVYVKVGPGRPPEPTICPWKCGWMNLVGERTARGL